MQLDYESGHADLTTADCNGVYFPSHIPRRIIGVYSHMKTNSCKVQYKRASWCNNIGDYLRAKILWYLTLGMSRIAGIINRTERHTITSLPHWGRLYS